jgi:hypothetical protein
LAQIGGAAAGVPFGTYVDVYGWESGLQLLCGLALLAGATMVPVLTKQAWVADGAAAGGGGIEDAESPRRAAATMGASPRVEWESEERKLTPEVLGHLLSPRRRGERQREEEDQEDRRKRKLL